MPSKTQLVRNDILVSSGDVGTSHDLKSYSRQQPSSKTSKDKALSPRANQSLKLLETKDRNRVHPPHNLGKRSGDNGISTKHRGNQPGQLGMNSGFIDGELIRYMSSLPGYLQQGDNVQDKVLNFGVLDWERLEKWKRKHNRISSRGSASTSSSSSLLSSSGRRLSETTNFSSALSNEGKGRPLGSRKKSAADLAEASSLEADPYLKIQAHSEKMMNVCGKKKGERPKYTGNDKSLGGHNSLVNCLQKEAGNLNGIRETMGMRASSSKVTSKASSISLSERNGVLDNKPKTMVENVEGDYDPVHEHDHVRQDSVVLLLPKDFSKSGCLDDPQSTSCDSNSAELNSFSDVFSIEELRLEESIPDIPHSCPITFMAETENDLDRNIHKLTRAQRKSFLSDQPSLSYLLNNKVSFEDEAKLEKNYTNETRDSNMLDNSQGSEHNCCDPKSSKTRDPSPPARQLSFGIGRLARSFSFKESSGLPRLSHSSIKSGPARAPTSDGHDCSTHNTLGATAGRAKSSTLKRLLDPLLKPKASKPNSSPPGDGKLNGLNIMTINIGENEQSDKLRSSMTVKAILYLTLKNGLPLFKFLVESRNEILASSVKRLSPLKKDDPSCLYTFYLVQKTKRKSGGGWKYQGSKGRGSEFCYNVIGQLKVSEPIYPATVSEEGVLVEKFTRESVLYGVDLSKVNAEDSESAPNEELGAIVVQNSKHIFADEENSKYEKNAEENIGGSIVVILPSGIHSMPNEGGPSSLISRWRSGGSCDCGGWDVGCKPQILTNNDQEKGFKIHRPSRACADHHDCKLYLQGRHNKQNNHPVFRLIAHGDEAVYSIEYHAAISSLQAFAIAVAVLSSQDQPDDIFDSTYSYRDELRKGHYRSKSAMVQVEGTAKYATNPPLSPVGRA